MADTTTQERSAPPGPRSNLRAGRAFERAIGHPIGFLVTAFVLLALFGWTFIDNPDRVAPTKDPAYYTWRTEVLLSEEPVRLIEIEGPEDLFAAGYRVSAPVIGGFLRQIADVSSLKMTIFLMVFVPVATALLLGGFAYRQRRDPLMFHVVAFGSASLFLTYPFVGYLDNLLALFFLASALMFLGPARESFRGRIAFAAFLFLTGLTHPTTLVIFGLLLGAISAVRVIARRWDVRSVIRDDGPMLLSALAAAVVTYVVWTIGVWGEGAPLAEAALPPPYESEFFVDRLVSWVKAMLPAINAPFLALGIVGLLIAGRKAAEDDLTTVSILWLGPLIGIFGFLIGKSYPYYRFFNATLAWVLLVGVGMYFVARFCILKAREGGASRAAAVGVIAVAAAIAANFAKGYDVHGWNDAARGWLSADERRDLDALRAFLAANADEDQPVVFVVDDEDTSPRVYGTTKLAGNTSRYGLPHGQIDQAYLYLGTLDNFLGDQPTLRDLETYDELTTATLADARAGIAAADEPPIVVVAQVFNETGSNAGYASGADPLPDPESVEVLAVADGSVSPPSQSLDLFEEPQGSDDDAGVAHAAWVAFALALMLLPGLLALRWFLPDAAAADAVALTVPLSVGMLTIGGFVVLAIARSPFSDALAWASLGAALVAGAALRLLSRR